MRSISATMCGAGVYSAHDRSGREAGDSITSRDEWHQDGWESYQVQGQMHIQFEEFLSPL